MLLGECGELPRKIRTGAVRGGALQTNPPRPTFCDPGALSALVASHGNEQTLRAIRYSVVRDAQVVSCP
jgi:hypothetical protein